MGSCLSLEELEDHRAGRLDGTAHLAGCEACASALAKLEHEGELFDELRSALRGDADELAGEVADRFEVRAVIHRGGQGVVYDAVLGATGERVALKVLLGGAQASWRDRRRFMREVELASALEHPAVVRVIDSGLADGHFYSAMEFVEGTRLDEYLRKTPLDQARRLGLFAAIGEAVQHAHQRGVLHRDLKPSNILIDARGGPRVLDFGLARPVAVVDEAERLTRTGEFLGTLAYASPEQVEGGEVVVDTRSDVYSLGVILYEMVTGQLPYDVSGKLTGVVERIAQAPPVDPRKLASGVSDDLATVVLHALEKRPERRYASVDAFVRDVRRVIAGRPIEARSLSTGELLWRWTVRHRAMIGLAAVLVLGIAAFGVVLVREQLRREQERATNARLRAIVQDVLAAAGPDRMGGGATLVDLFEDVAQLVEDGLEDAPDAQAAVRLTIGETYLRNLRAEEAIPHLQAALARYREFDDDDQLEVARCLELLGRALTAIDGNPGAIDVQREALALRRAALGEDHEQVVASLRHLAHAIQRADADLAESARLLDEAAEIASGWRDRPLEVAKVRHALATQRWREGDREAAEREFRRARVEFASGGELDRVGALECLDDFASFLLSGGAFQEAESLLEESIALRRQLYGDEQVVDVLQRLAQLNRERGDLAGAERFAREALALDLEQWALRQPVEATRLRRLAAQVSDAFERGEEPPLVQTCRALMEFRGRGSWELASWMNELAELCVARERVRLATQLLREATKIHCRLYGSTCPVRMRTLEQLGAILLEHGDAREACGVLEEALEIRTANGEDDGAAGVRALLAEARQRAAGS